MKIAKMVTGNKKDVLRSLAMAMLLSCIASANAASIIFDNAVPNTLGARTSDAASTSGVGFFSADNFALLSGATITGVEWSGRYTLDPLIGPCCPAPATDNFTIAFFDDVSGLPALSSFASFNVGNSVNRTLSSTISADIFSYSAAISPLTLNAGTTYWLSIFNNATEAGNIWNWSTAAGPNPPAPVAAFRSGVSGTWAAGFSDHDYRLTGVPAAPVAAIPEPEIYAMLGVGLGLLGWLKRRKKLTVTVAS